MAVSLRAMVYHLNKRSNHPNKYLDRFAGGGVGSCSR